MGVDGQFDWKLTIESVRLIKKLKKKKKNLKVIDPSYR